MSSKAKVITADQRVIIKLRRQLELAHRDILRAAGKLAKSKRALELAHAEILTITGELAARRKSWPTTG